MHPIFSVHKCHSRNKIRATVDLNFPASQAQQYPTVQKSLVIKLFFATFHETLSLWKLSKKSQTRETDISRTFHRLMKIYAEETASNSHKATAYLPFRLSIRNVYRMVQRNPPKIMSNQLHFRVKSSRDSLCDPLFPGVLIIWRRIVPFTVTRVHERARGIAAHSPIFPPHLFRKYITTPNVCCRGCVRDVTRVQNGLTSCNSLVVI